MTTLAMATAATMAAMPLISVQSATVDSAPFAIPLTTATATSTPGSYMPLVVNHSTPQPASTSVPTSTTGLRDTVFGIETASVLRSGDKLASAGTTWVRRNGLLWDAVEPTEGARNWSAVSDFEAELIQATKLHLKIILVVRGTPAWAQKYRGSSCGPIKSDKLEAFGRFLRDAVERYSIAPYDVKYWEIWNEPDAPVVIKDNVWGCWGEPSDSYYGGRYYAQALQAAYPQIKAADPQSQVLIGGLLMNCDPIKPPPGADCKHSKFFEGILVGGGAPYFDGVSFHTYDYYYDAVGKYGSDNWHSAWNTTGPLLINKGRFLKDVMKDYNVTGKFLMDTELAVLCWDCPSTANYETTKAYYSAQAYAAAMAEGLKGVTWYSLEGWNGSNMTDGNLNAKPVLLAYQVGRSKLGDSVFQSKVTPEDVGGLSGVAGYKFSRVDSTGEVWLIWRLNGDTRAVTFSRVPSAMTDALGVSIIPTQSFTLTIKPIYVEWSSSQ